MTDTQKIQRALHLIKLHIEAENTPKNRDLHNAVQLIVDVCREHNILETR